MKMIICMLLLILIGYNPTMGKTDGDASKENTIAIQDTNLTGNVSVKILDKEYIEKNFIELGGLISLYSIPFEESNGISLPWTKGGNYSGIYWIDDSKKNVKDNAARGGYVSVTINGKPSHIKDGKVQEKSWTIELLGANVGIQSVKIKTYNDDGEYFDVPGIISKSVFKKVLMGCDKKNTPLNFRKLYYYYNDFDQGWMDIHFDTDSTGGATMSYEILMYPPVGPKYKDLDRDCTE